MNLNGIPLINEVQKFTYLGSMMSKDAGSDRSIAARIGKARAAFISLSSVWRSKLIDRKNKLHIFNTNVKSVLLYGSETRGTPNSKKIQTFVTSVSKNVYKFIG